MQKDLGDVTENSVIKIKEEINNIKSNLDKINDVAGNVYNGSITFLTSLMDTALPSYNDTIDDCNLYLEGLD